MFGISLDILVLYHVYFTSDVVFAGLIMVNDMINPSAWWYLILHHVFFLTHIACALHVPLFIVGRFSIIVFRDANLNALDYVRTTSTVLLTGSSYYNERLGVSDNRRFDYSSTLLGLDNKENFKTPHPLTLCMGNSGLHTHRANSVETFSML